MKIGICCVEGCTTSGQMRKGMCRRHYNQILIKGSLQDRTNRDPSEIEILDGYALVYAYDKAGVIRGKSKIDLSDVENVGKYRWRIGNADGYFYCSKIKVMLHNFVMGVANGEKLYDHINRDPADNRKNNLRECNLCQNAQNRKTRADNKLGIKGVIYKESSKKYETNIMQDGKRYFLGSFPTLLEAAQAYNKKAIELHGPFASTNDISAVARGEA